MTDPLTVAWFAVVVAGVALIVAILRPHPTAALITEMQRSREALGAGVELLAEGLKDRAEVEQRIRALIEAARKQ